jgi:elongation factor P
MHGSAAHERPRYARKFPSFRSDFPMNSTDLRPGMAIKLDGRMWVITQYTHVTPGNLRAFVQIKIKDIEKGTIIEKRLRSGESVEQVELDRRPMEYLYADGKKYVFMDDQSFEQSEFDESVVGEMPLYVLPNTKLVVLWCDGKPVSVEMPNVVELTVTDTPPGIKGATATNQLKEATLETGLKTRVPPFITNGEKVRINTVDGSYNSRA